MSGPKRIRRMDKPVTVRAVDPDTGTLKDVSFRIDGRWQQNPEFVSEAWATGFLTINGKDDIEYTILPVTMTGYR